MISPTAGIKVPRWTGMAHAWASVVPSSVKMLAEASSPSLTIGEHELLSSVVSISSAMQSRRWRNTSSVTGSKRPGSMPVLMPSSPSAAPRRRPRWRASRVAPGWSKSSCSITAGPRTVSAAASLARSWMALSQAASWPGKCTALTVFWLFPGVAAGVPPSATFGRRAICTVRKLTILAADPVLWPLRRSCAVSKAS